MQKKDIVKFTDLVAWKEAHKLVLMTYREVKQFPNVERFGLSLQMARCAVSISSNIAEGFSRSTPKDKNQFYYISRGSVTELQNQMLIARDLGYIDAKSFSRMADQSVLVHKLVNGLIKSNTIPKKPFPILHQNFGCLPDGRQATSEKILTISRYSSYFFLCLTQNYEEL